ncbi:TerD family protein [Streptomyces albipurpureus]|uniref:TerD family protein n=1 Tax=Streptomyces albipurpureus TaxID=2897419 RepID=A0ABT0UW01_9ACTN|nr:TerD family protein [Streptomyces sp. CWNU-1]MCM2391361.1 TerD family protein [Streptomyces sp. CWNU-1]
MRELAKGGNASVEGSLLTVELQRTSEPVDLTALLIYADGKVRSDADMVFFNQPSAGDGAVRHMAAEGDTSERIMVEPLGVSPSVERVVLVGSCDSDDANRTFAQVAELSIRVTQEGAEPLRFQVPPMTDGERAAVLLELYRRGDGWKVRAVGQGYSSGLAGVATDFGIEVEEEPAEEPPAQPVTLIPALTIPPGDPSVAATAPGGTAAPAAPADQGGAATSAVAPAPTAVSAPEPGAPLPSPPMSLTKPPLGRLSLDKGSQAVFSLDKNDRGLEIVATLDWDGGSDRRRARGADLDFYALFVPAAKALQGLSPAGTRVQSGHAPKGTPFRPSSEVPPPAVEEPEGRKRWRRFKQANIPKNADVVYYKRLGSLESGPHIQLDGDSKTPGRETIRITRPDEHGYVLFCAYSALSNGSGSFLSFGAKVVIDDGHGSVVTVPLFEETETSYWVAIALVDFTTPEGAAIRHIEAYSNEATEKRPVLHLDGTVEMDAGPVEFKNF